MNINDKVFSCLGVWIFTIVLLIAASILNGWALTKLWAWFVVPIFDLPYLRIVEAIGLAMIVSFLTGTRKGTEDSNKAALEVHISSTIYAIGYPLLAVFFGWIVAGFM